MAKLQRGNCAYFNWLFDVFYGETFLYTERHAVHALGEACLAIGPQSAATRILRMKNKKTVHIRVIRVPHPTIAQRAF
jgi:hypothetical protein